MTSAGFSTLNNFHYSGMHMKFRIKSFSDNRGDVIMSGANATSRKDMVISLPAFIISVIIFQYPE